MSADQFFFFLLVAILAFAFIYKPLRYFFRVMFPKLEDIVERTPEELAKINNVQLFNISDIGKVYEVLGMIEAQDTDKTKAKEKLQEEAYVLGANAVINVSTNIDNNVTGTVGSVVTMPRIVEGKTSTATTYHYEGTAVKLI